jgi:hypothetical protein
MPPTYMSSFYSLVLSSDGDQLCLRDPPDRITSLLPFPLSPEDGDRASLWNVVILFKNWTMDNVQINKIQKCNMPVILSFTNRYPQWFVGFPIKVLCALRVSLPISRFKRFVGYVVSIEKTKIQTQFLSERFKWKSHLWGLDRRIILKCILHKWSVAVCTELNWWV